MLTEKIGRQNISGTLSIFDVTEDGNLTLLGTTENKFMASGADVIANLLSGTPNYNIKTMYLEYENSSPGAVVEPGYVVADGLEYYTGLTSPKDYLRIPITTNPVVSSSDESSYEGNQVTFFGITSGTVGVNGLAFSETAGSTVYGGALVASPDLQVPTKDRVFARTYWVDRLFPKYDGRQIGVQWTVRIVATD